MFTMLRAGHFLCTLLICLCPLLAHAEKILTVYTVNYPLTYFAERIGGDHVKVVFPAPRGVDPAFWLPDEGALRAYQQADLIILNGAEYARWTKKVSLPMLRSVDTSRAFKKDLLHLEATVTHNHGPGGEHSHAGIAFTTWLDFSQAIHQAEAVYKALSKKKPDLQGYFSTNFAALHEDLMQLDEQMKILGEQLQGAALLASHPIYQYLARRYDLNLKMVMWEPDADPGEKQWQYVQDVLETHQARWMLWEGEPLESSAKRLKTMSVQSLVFSPCFSRPETGNFLSVMKQNISNMNKTLNSTTK